MDVVVIGAGAAGILAAAQASLKGLKVVLLEKTDRVGTKILVSGGGKCNITHAGSVEDVLRDYRANEARFLRPSFYRFFNDDILEILESRGLETYTRENGRVFPVNQTAKDVCRILRDYLEDCGVEVRLETPVLAIKVAPEGGFSVEISEGSLNVDKVVLCVGGSSYPKTGTTGDGYPWVAGLGHTLVPIQAALAPMEVDFIGGEYRAGVALRDVVLKGRLSGKEVARWRDDLLFTHRGVSGPTVLGLSREVEEAMGTGPVTLEVDLVPNLPFEVVSAELKGWKAGSPRHTVGSLAEAYVPKSLVEVFLSAAGLEAGMKAQEIDKKELNRLVEVIKGWKFGTVREVVLEKGEVVAGGVALDEVDPHTMESRICPGLFLAGEILDIAGPVGGYNLQAAWSTGFVAGDSV